MQLINFYYSLNVEQNGDDLLSLCRDCAAKHSKDVQWASTGDDQSECEFCRASNDPQYSRRMDAEYAALLGR